MIKQHSRGLAPSRGTGHQGCTPSDDESATSSSSDDEDSDVAEEQTTDDAMQGHPGGWIFPSADSEIDHKEYTIGETMSLVSDQCKDDRAISGIEECDSPVPQGGADGPCGDNFVPKPKA